MALKDIGDLVEANKAGLSGYSFYDVNMRNARLRTSL